MSAEIQTISLYHSPHQFTPILPSQKLEALVKISRPVIEESLKLRQALCEPTMTALRELVRAMNSYYSNRIEGQGTHPLDIEQALKAKFSSTPDIAYRQRLALAHIEAEKELERYVTEEHYTEAQALRSSFLLKAHKALYSRLDAADRKTEDGRVLEPGVIRTVSVSVGTHIPPAPEAIPRFMQYLDTGYSTLTGLDAVLYTTACAHHRFAWVHPFDDGNGRSCRLQTHAALFALSGGLWSVNRGLARQRERYYTHMENADSIRQGDYDGRGNLSESALYMWCAFFIDTCHDQVEFMSKMLDIAQLRDRIAQTIRVLSVKDPTIFRDELILPLWLVATSGPFSRQEFAQMIGLPARTVSRILARLLQEGILVSPSPKGHLTFGFPLQHLHLLMPNLYPEAATLNLGDH